MTHVMLSEKFFALFFGNKGFRATFCKQSCTSRHAGGCTCSYLPTKQIMRNSVIKKRILAGICMP